MNIRDAVFVVIDVESTGLDPAKDKLCEIAAVATTSLHVVGMWATLVDPGIPIPPETMGIHGITDAMVKGAPDASAAVDMLCRFENVISNAVTPAGKMLTEAAHNAVFDQAFVEPAVMAEFPWLCTKRLAQHLWPDAPNHKNQTLRYWRDLKFDDYGIQAHRALGDAIVTAALLRDIIANESGIITVEALQALSDAPIRYTKMPFGKHFGVAINELPKDYVRWALANVTDMNEDLKWTLQQV